MQTPIQITMRNMDHSAAVEERIRQKALKLDHFSENLISCRVVVEQNQAHKQHGASYNVRINVNMPRHELVVNHNEQENLYVAIRDAFDNMERRVKDASRMMHGEVKHHGLTREEQVLSGNADG